MKSPIKNNDNLHSNNNFEVALNLSEKDYTHTELLTLLKNGNIAEKQIAALKIDCIASQTDARILLSNLTGCDGKIREAVAYKINYFITCNPETRKLFAEDSSDIFANATIDINANICRQVVNSTALLKEFDLFRNNYLQNILKYTNEAINELDKFIYKDKKYVINKQLFKLYWCLEALSYFQEFIDDSLLYDILLKCINQQEYTIREKCAQIVTESKSNKIQKLQKKLMNDENYYVRQVFISSKHP